MLLQDIWTVFWRDWIVLQRRLKINFFNRRCSTIQSRQNTVQISCKSITAPPFCQSAQ